MARELSLLLVLMSFHGFLCSDTQTIYISIANETCTVNGNESLRPCRSLQQLSNARISLSNKRSIKLLLLPGIHVISQSSSLKVSNVRKFEIHPWNEQHEVTVKGQLTFNDIGELKIHSIDFTSCQLEFNFKLTNSKNSLTVSLLRVSLTLLCLV